MADRPLTAVLDRLRQAALRHDDAGLTDGELLECFIAWREEAAFAALVRRHGPMVLRVCRRVLRNEADAEDAFQATFLVLVRKARSVRPPGMVGNWLYGVAHNTARNLKAMNLRRRQKEREAGAAPKQAAPEEAWEEVKGLLDRELPALPDKYRAPIVLCDLEGKTIHEAARQFGWPQGTVATRLARGRELLARRLARHGLSLSGGALAMVMAQGAASAGVPAPWVDSSVRAATAVAAGRAAAAGVISVRAAALTEGVVKAMLMRKLKALAAMLLAVTLLGGGALLTAHTLRAGQKDEKARSDHEQIQGTWTVVSGEKGGKRGDAGDGKVKVIIGKDKITVEKDGNQVEEEATYELGPTKKPKWIDLTVKREGKEGTMRGIYELDGDSLKICLNERPDDERSTEFVSKAGTPNDRLLILKRDKR